MPASTRNSAGADSAAIGTATRVGNRMSTEPKDIDHETEPLRPILEAPWFEMAPADEVTRRLSNEIYVTQLEVAVR